MSRIGKKPISVPSGVKIGITPEKIDVQGPKGKLTVGVPRRRPLRAERRRADRSARHRRPYAPLHGLARALVANAVHGVTQGFKKDMDIVGVGYRAELKGKMLISRWAIRIPIEFPIPEGIQVPSKSRRTWSSGADHGQVGQVCRRHSLAASPDRTSRKASASPANA